MPHKFVRHFSLSKTHFGYLIGILRGVAPHPTKGSAFRIPLLVKQTNNV